MQVHDIQKKRKKDGLIAWLLINIGLIGLGIGYYHFLYPKEIYVGNVSDKQEVASANDPNFVNRQDIAKDNQYNILEEDQYFGLKK